MKTTQDVHDRLRAELDQWFFEQSQQPMERFYLYYLPTTPEHDGGFLFATDKPANPDYKLACVESVNGFRTVDQNMIKFIGIVNRLPILEREQSDDYFNKSAFHEILSALD